MTRNYISPWYRARYSVTEWDAQLLCEVSAAYVPTILADLEVRKTPRLSENEAAYALDYQNICEQQVALLMNIGDRIISEVRAGRNGNQTPLEARDPSLDPYELDLASLLGINVALVAADGRDVASILQSIEAKIEASGVDSDEILGLLQQVVLLLGV